jgi:uncharacterized membrane protein (DUF485 family)
VDTALDDPGRPDTLALPDPPGAAGVESTLWRRTVMTSISSFTRAPDTGNANFSAIRQNEDFVRMRRRLLRVTVPLTLIFLTWYLTYVLLAAYAPDLMSYRVTGAVTIGLLLGLSQFASTIVIMLIYGRFARRHIDPEVEALRRRAGVGER